MEPRRIAVGPQFGGPSGDYIDILFWLCHLSGAKNVVEIGSGHSIIPLLLACKRNGGRLFSTDSGGSDGSDCDSDKGGWIDAVKNQWKIPTSYMVI